MTNDILNLFREINNKTLIFLILFIATILEFIGFSLVYPALAIIFELEIESNNFLSYINSFIDKYLNFLNKFLLLSFIVAVMLFRSLFLIYYKLLCASTTIRFMNDLRKKIYKNYFLSNYNFINDKKNKFFNSITEQSQIAHSSMQVFFNICEQVLAIILLSILSILISAKIYFLCLFFGFFLMLIFNISIKYAKKIGKELTYLNEKFYNNINLSHTNVRYIKSTNIFFTFFSQLKPLLNEIFKKQVLFVFINRGTSLITEPILLFSLILIFTIGLYIFDLPIITIVLMYALVARILGKFLKLITEYQNLSKELIAFNYCRKFIQNIQESTSTSNFQKSVGKIENIQLNNINFAYDSKVIFNELNLQIEKNKITSIYGKSGSGKTTIFNLIIGLVEPQVGEVKINSSNLEHIDIISYRSKIGLVSQENIIFNMSIRDNLNIRNKNIDDSKMIKLIEEFDLKNIFPNQNIDLEYNINETSSNLSGGEKQRLALIRELLIEPNILLLDEVTSSLDQINIKKIINYIKKIRNTITIVILTHQKEYLEISDKTYFIKNNKLSSEQ